MTSCGRCSSTFRASWTSGPCRADPAPSWRT
ncbi:hypothetical protein CRUP_010706 [Coryphaenoides rupestris]|nr:hypothetical protein CRUP_010706 [Coryphaenoides rupestris]